MRGLNQVICSQCQVSMCWISQNLHEMSWDDLRKLKLGKSWPSSFSDHKETRKQVLNMCAPWSPFSPGPGIVGMMAVNKKLRNPRWIPKSVWATCSWYWPGKTLISQFPSKYLHSLGKYSTLKYALPQEPVTMSQYDEALAICSGETRKD